MAVAGNSFEDIEAALKRAVAALREAGVPFLLGGSLASWARGGPESRHDLDVIVRPEDAERALDALAAAGMRPERPPEEWLYKAWDGEVPIDVIFRPRGLEIDDHVLARGDEIHVQGITLPVMALEDVLATKLLALDDHSVDYSPLLQIVRALREQIDWRALRGRTRHSPYARAFFFLVEELGVADTGSADTAEVRVVTPER
jgi:hypothetical protein